MSTRFVCLVALAACFLCPQISAARDSGTSLLGLNDSFKSLTDKVSPSVVQVLASGLAPLSAGGDRFVISKHRSTGSGFIVSEDGYIITNAHVVFGSTNLKVRLPPHYAAGVRKQSSIVKSEGGFYPAKLIGFDRETDIALLKIRARSLVPLELADSDSVSAGQVALAFGSPLGLAGSVSFGIVSAVARQIGPDHPMVYLQTDAPINPGNSGGPLVNIDGAVIGVNTFILSQSGGSEGLGFAVPSNIVNAVYGQLKAKGRVSRGSIGAHVQSITATLASGLGLPRAWGVFVADVYPNGPASKSGLAVGDVVLTLNGKRMENGRQFDVNVYQLSPGSRAKIQVLRGKTLKTFTVPVERQPDAMGTAGGTLREQLVEHLGILGRDVDAQIARAIPTIRGPGGVLVLGAAADTELSGGAAFSPGDIIRGLNTITIKSLSDLKSAARSLVPGESVVLRVERRGQLLYLPFELE